MKQRKTNLKFLYILVDFADYFNRKICKIQQITQIRHIQRNAAYKTGANTQQILKQKEILTGNLCSLLLKNHIKDDRMFLQAIEPGFIPTWSNQQGNGGENPPRGRHCEAR